MRVASGLVQKRNAPRNSEPATRHYNRPRMKGLLLALSLLVATAASAKLPFIENDYTAALTRARAKNVPIFVDAWAPW